MGRARRPLRMAVHGMGGWGAGGATTHRLRGSKVGRAEAEEAGEVAAAEASVAGSTATKGLRVGVGKGMESRRGRAHTQTYTQQAQQSG